MALTPEEQLSRRLNDPYYGLAEQLAQPSVYDRKKASLASATAKKKAEQDPAAALSDEISLAEGNLLDLMESGFRQSGMQLKDFFTPREFLTPRTNEEIREQADRESGLSAEARQRLATDPQQKVAESLAQGEYLRAVPEAVVAAPGVLAESASFLAEIAGGALLTRFGGSAGRRLAGKRVKEKAGSIFAKADKPRDSLTKLVASKTTAEQAFAKAALTIPKAAGAVSVATADITQRNNNDFRELHGRDMTRGELSFSYMTNLTVMMPIPAIWTKLFIPSARKTISKEIQTLGKNLKGGSNLKSIAIRVIDGAKKVGIAGGAEATQEYFQTWAEALNVSLGPEERKQFFKSALAVVKDKDKQLESLVGAYLGLGAGGAIRFGVTAPAVAAGTAVDTVKGTAKTAVKGTVALAKTAGKVVQHVADKASFQVLSEEEIKQIRSEHGSRSVIANQTITKLKTSINKIEKATTIEELRADPEIEKRVSAIIRKKEISDEALKDKKVIKNLKLTLLAKYRGDIGLIKADVLGKTGASLVKQSATNIKDKAVESAVAVVEAVSPGLEVVLETVKGLGPKVIKAVDEIQSSTALGMIELSTNAGKEETKQILLAAKSLNKEDLERVTAVIGSLKPEIGRQLNIALKAKDKALERSGLKRNEIITHENLNPIVKDITERGDIPDSEIAPLSSAINESVASVIEDIDSIEDLEFALAAVEKSNAFKTQTEGAMSRDNAVIVKRKLQRARARLEGRPKKVVDKIKETATKVVEKVTPVIDSVVEQVKEAAAEIDSVKISSTFRAVVEAVSDTLKDPSQAGPLVDSADLFIKQMKRFGVETRAQFENFVKQFPELETNIDFFKQLDEAYPTDISANEVFDIVKTKAVETVQKIKDAYNSMNPPTCKI